MGDIPLPIDANNWFSIHRNPGVNWVGRKNKGDRKHTIIEEFYDPLDSARAIYRNFWSRNLRNNKGSTFKVGDIFDKSDVFGAYAENPQPYFDTMEDFGYTKDSIINLRDLNSTKKFFEYLAAIEIGREYFDKNISAEEKKRVIEEGIQKGLDSLLNDETYKYREQFLNEINKPQISIEFTGDKQEMQQGGFIRQPQMINDPTAAPAPLRADDVDLQAQEGDFIMGYPAMQTSGTRVRSLVEQAMLKAKDKGLKTKGYKHGDKVDILVHNGEMHIPKELIPYVEGGDTTLKKLNQPSKYEEGGFVDKMAMLREGEQQEQQLFQQQREKEFAEDPRSKAISGVTEEEEKQRRVTDIEKLHSNLKKPERIQLINSLTAPEKGNDDFAFGRNKTLPAIHMNGSIGQQKWEKMKDKLSVMINNYSKKKPHVNYDNLFNLYVSTVNNIKEGIEESDGSVKTDLILDSTFLKNAWKATQIHTKLNVANKMKSNEELNYTVNIKGNSLVFDYPHGTPHLMEKEKIIPQNRHPEKVTYSKEEGFKDNWLATMRNAEKDSKNLDINEKGGFGFSHIDHEIEMPDYLNDMIPYIKEVEGYTDEPKKEPIEKQLYSIYWGHQLTASQLEDWKNGKLTLDPETILQKDLIEADMLAEKVYNKYLKSEKFKQVANDLNLNATGPNYKNLPVTSKKMLVDMAFNLGSKPKLEFGDYNAGLKGYAKFMAAIANNDSKLMLKEYKRYYTSSNGTLRELTGRNNKFRDTFLYKLDEILGNKKHNPRILLNHLGVLQ